MHILPITYKLWLLDYKKTNHHFYEKEPKRTTENNFLLLVYFLPQFFSTLDEDRLTYDILN